MFHNFSILFDSGTLGDNWILTFTLLEVSMLLSDKYMGDDQAPTQNNQTAAGV